MTLFEGIRYLRIKEKYIYIFLITFYNSFFSLEKNIDISWFFLYDKHHNFKKIEALIYTTFKLLLLQNDQPLKATFPIKKHLFSLNFLNYAEHSINK